MRTGLAVLVLGNVLSQFYRAFLAVLSPMLAADIGVTAEQLARASGLWFVAFALMQLPVGWALDRVGPRRTAAVLLGGVAGGSALLFAFAQGPGMVTLAMVLLGIGCAPVLMAGYYIIGRVYAPAVFATLAGALIGVSALGNLASAWPLAWAAETFGWRGAMIGIAVITMAVGAAIWRFVEDPPPPEGRRGQGSVFDLLRMPALWLILPLMLVNYAPSAGLRGLWVGPYFEEVFGETARGIGLATLVMGLAMVAGNLAYGPLDRLFGTRKGVVLGGNLAGIVCLAALWWAPASGFWPAALLLAGVGFFGASFPMLMAHGRSLFPPHLLGRGVTLMNLFGIGGAGLMQLASGPVQVAAAARAATPAEAYGTLFGFFGLCLLAGCLVYAFSRDRTD